MRIQKNKATAILLFCCFIFQINAGACSMYKLTLYGKTMVGCNHDTWLTTPRIWFEKTGYGAAFTGARFDGENGFAPQSGMNEFGLAFSRLAAPTPENGSSPAGKKSIHNQTLFLKQVMHQCKTVEEVQAFIEQYDHSVFAQDVFIYIDRTGKYLIVEPFTTALGNDPNYVQSNFCPSQVEDFSAINQERYHNGVAFLNHQVDTTLAYCTSLSDTMSVSRKRIGDGTLITSIWDTQEGTTTLFFYHDYSHQVQFNIKDELAKGDHLIDITTLFPSNTLFTQFKEFKTAVTSESVDIGLAFGFIFFFACSIVFFISFWRKRSTTQLSWIKLALSLLTLLCAFFIFALKTEVGIYYMAAPYVHYKASLLNIVGYIPFLLLLLIIPFFAYIRKVFVGNSWGFLPKWLFALNGIALLVLIGMSFYWGLYDVFG